MHSSRSPDTSDPVFDLLASDRPWVAIAANPYGGCREARDLVERLHQAIRRRGLEAAVLWDRVVRDTVLRHSDLARCCRCVVAVGGDGTVADVINELPPTVPLATFPAGNENLFAREFGFRPDPEQIAQAIESRRTRQIDLGTGCGRRFSLMISAGFDAEVAHRVARKRGMPEGPGKVNRLSYAKPIFDALRSYPYSQIELEADGVAIQGAHALVFNLPQYGFQMPFAPRASAEDGFLDWVVFSRPGLCSMAIYWVALMRSKHLSRSDVHWGRARRIQIRSAGSVPVQMDGDPSGFTPVSVEVLPGALQILVPGLG